MSKQILTEKNYNFLLKTLSNIYKDEDKLKKALKNAITHVKSKVNKKTPPGMLDKKYLYLMNKKVINLVLSKLKNDIPTVKENFQQNNQKQNIEKQNVENNEMQTRIQDTENSDETYGHIFDPSKTVYVDNNTNVMDRPMAQTNMKYQNDISNEFQNLQQNRDSIFPKVKPVNFADDNNNEFENTNDLFNNIIKKRENDNNFNDEQKRFGSFDDFQKSINNEINTFAENDNQQKIINEKATPIDVVLNPELQNNKNNIIQPQPFSTNIQPNNLNSNNNFVLDKTENTNNLSYNYNTTISKPNNIENFTSSTPQTIIKPQDNVILQKKKKLITKDYYITIDSRDRDLAIYTSPYNFQVKFVPTSNSIAYGKFTDDNNNIIYESKTIYFGDDQGANILKNYDNIEKIECLSVQLPILTNYMSGTMPTKYWPGVLPDIPTDASSNFYRGRFLPYWENYNGVNINIFSEPYFLLSIKELKGPYEGTNKYLSNAFAKLIPEFVTQGSGWNQNYSSHFMELKTSGSHEIYKYDPTNLGNLDKMSLLIQDKDGYEYTNMIDKLYILGVPINDGGTFYPSTFDPINISNCANNKFRLTSFEIAESHPSYCQDCLKKEAFYSFCDNCLSEYNIGLNTDASNNLANQSLQTLTLKIGDKIYFYDTRPQFPSIIFFHSSIKVKKILQCNLYNSKYYKKDCNLNNSCKKTDCNKEKKNACEKEYCESKDKDIGYAFGKIETDESIIPTKDYISIELIISNENEKTKVDMRTIFPKLYQENNFIDQSLSSGNKKILKYSDVYLYLSYTISGVNYKEFVKVVGFQSHKVIVERPINYPINKKMKVLKIGFAKSYKRGRQNDNKYSLFYRGGHRVVFLGEKDHWDDGKQLLNLDDVGGTVTIDLPYKYIKKDEKYISSNEVFIIQAKLQTSYTFKISTMVRDYEKLDSRWT